MERVSIISTNKFWKGGSNPEISHKIRIDMREISRTDNSIMYSIADVVIQEIEYDHNWVDAENVEHSEVRIIEQDMCTIREKTMEITDVQYDTLFSNADMYIANYFSEASIFVKEALRPQVALLLFWQNDKHSDKCLYNTEPADWQLI